jgi:hypothetical protein
MPESRPQHKSPRRSPAAGVSPPPGWTDNPHRTSGRRDHRPATGLTVLARGIQPPFQDVPGDHQRSRDDPIPGNLRIGANVDQDCPRPADAGTANFHSRASRSAFAWLTARRRGTPVAYAPISAPPWTLECPWIGIRPHRDRPTNPRDSVLLPGSSVEGYREQHLHGGPGRRDVGPPRLANSLRSACIKHRVRCPALANLLAGLEGASEQPCSSGAARFGRLYQAEVARQGEVRLAASRAQTELERREDLCPHPWRYC